MTDQLVIGVGGELARAREARGLALAEVAQQLKFAPRQLEALEQEKFERLPGPTIARGMVRSYARLLKLDPDPLLERLAGRLEPTDANRLAARFRQPVPFSDNARRSTLIYLGLSLGILGVVGAVAYEWHQERNAPRPLAAAPARATATIPLPAQPVAAPVPVEEKPPVLALPEPRPQPQVQPQAQAQPQLQPGVHRLVLRCEAESWIEVTDGAGRRLAASLNPAGTERVVEGRPPFGLVIGNAQHVKLSHNGKPVDLQPHIKVEVARFTLK